MKKIYLIIVIAACLLLTTSTYSQITKLNNVASAATEFAGWDGTGAFAKDFDLRSGFGSSYNMNFWTNGNPGTQRMIILGANGRVGIGTTAPNELLQVAGNIRIGSTNQYKLAGNKVLWHNNNIEDIFVGVNAGNNSMSGHANSFVGYNTGIANTSGDSLTFVGYGAGAANTEGRWNTAIGCNALNSSFDLMYNTAVGYQSMYLSSTCPLCWDQKSTLNTAVGYQSLYSTQGYGACAIGFRAGYSNDEGCGTIAIGEESMHDNTNGNYNIAVGNHSLHENTNLGWNVAVGHWALYTQNYDPGSAQNSNNVAMGFKALYSNNPTSTSNGKENTSVGNFSLYSNSNGAFNTAIGYNAGASCLTGDSNVFVGYGADLSGAGFGNYNNCAAFGYGAVAAASDKFYFGNAKVIECRALLWTSTSDGRFKINVQENVSGLDFINRLRPVTYNMDAQALDAFINPNVRQAGDFTDATKRVHSGFIAQEVERAALDAGFTSSIVSLPGGTNDPYGLNYSEFVVPLVKAVQQLDSINKSLQGQITALQGNNSVINSPTQNQGNNESSQQRNSGSIELQDLQTLQLLNADPNPFSESTMIRWNIPNDFKDAMIYFYDNTGVKINSYKIGQSGNGQLQIFGSKLSSGIYTYSLVVDSKIIDSKKFVKEK